MMSGKDAINCILDINETVENLKERNTETTPDLTLCKAVELLEIFRDIVICQLDKTTIF